MGNMEVRKMNMLTFHPLRAESAKLFWVLVSESCWFADCLLTGQHDEVMTVVLNFLFLGNEIVRHLDILVSTWMHSLMLTGTPISYATILKNFDFLSYEGKSPLNLLYSLLIWTHAASSLTQGSISVGSKCIIVWVCDKVCREAKSELQGWI